MIAFNPLETMVIKLLSNTTVAGLISHDDEGHYREQVEISVKRCSENNLELKVANTKETIIDFRSGNHEVLPLVTSEAEVETGRLLFKCLGIFISNSMGWAEQVD